MRDLLKSALLRMDAGGQTGHPTADVLAAFSQNGLQPQERNSVLEHLARCRACRECMAIISGAVAHSRRRAFPWKAACGLAASLCALVIALYFGPHHLADSNARAPALTAALKNPTVEHPGPEARELEVVWRFRPKSGRPVLQKSEDSGKSWKSVALTRKFRIQSLAWSGATAWVRGEDGGILESHDAGSHWTPLSFSPHELFADAVVRTGNSGTVTVITAAGDRWSRVNGVWHSDKSPDR